VICVNTTFRLTPWADVLYAMDRAWWEMHIREVKQSFSGLSVSPLTNCFSTQKARIDTKQMSNSGAGAIALAATWGAAKIYLLGYDCQKTDNKSHWHGDHPRKLGNAGSMPHWPSHFRMVAQRFPAVNIFNCSRETALNIFPRLPLEVVL
jgi:hypothetical protein